MKHAWNSNLLQRKLSKKRHKIQCFLSSGGADIIFDRLQEMAALTSAIIELPGQRCLILHPEAWDIGYFLEGSTWISKSSLLPPTSFVMGVESGLAYSFAINDPDATNIPSP